METDGPRHGAVLHHTEEGEELVRVFGRRRGIVQGP
jgi:hypothetical protein